MALSDAKIPLQNSDGDNICNWIKVYCVGIAFRCPSGSAALLFVNTHYSSRFHLTFKQFVKTAQYVHSLESLKLVYSCYYTAGAAHILHSDSLLFFFLLLMYIFQHETYRVMLCRGWEAIPCTICTEPDGHSRKELWWGSWGGMKPFTGAATPIKGFRLSRIYIEHSPRENGSSSLANTGRSLRFPP